MGDNRMFGSRMFGSKEVVSEIVGHGVFKQREDGLTKGLVRDFGHLFIQVLGWPDQENRLYFPRLVKLLEPCPTDLILDVGCGPGINALEIASRYGSAVTGVDIDGNDIRFAHRVGEINHIHDCRFICMDATDLRFESESFDKVMCMAVLEHIEDDSLAVQNIARILRKDGLLVGAVPTNERPRFKPECFQRSDDPKGHGHVREGYSVQDIDSLMRRNDLQLVRYEYVSGAIENLMLIVQARTNPYLAFPFTYPIAYIFSHLSKHGAGMLFKAVKKASNNMNWGSSKFR
jgi:SAM-dependent methyltransferase